jgi:hypothetical protein
VLKLGLYTSPLVLCTFRGQTGSLPPIDLQCPPPIMFIPCQTCGVDPKPTRIPQCTSSAKGLGNAARTAQPKSRVLAIMYFSRALTTRSGRMHLSFPSGSSPVRLRVPCTSPSPRSLRSQPLPGPTVEMHPSEILVRREYGFTLYSSTTVHFQR